MDRSVLVLGDGMLGSCVKKFLKSRNWNVFENLYRWPSDDFKKEVIDFDGLIVNCIGAIPQRTSDFRVNYELPEFLANIGKKVIHPATDCESDNTEYGLSKRRASELASENFKVIKASIIGFDKDAASLLSWVLAQEGPIEGYQDAKWNGITTLEWAQLCNLIMKNWSIHPYIITPCSEGVSKYELIKIILNVFGKNNEVIKIPGKGRDKRLNGVYVGNIRSQLIELKEFYEW